MSSSPDPEHDRRRRLDARRLPPRGDLGGEAAASEGATLIVEQKLALVRVRAVFVNDTEERAPLSYMLTVQRAGASGTAGVNRSGTFSLPTDEEKELTTLPVSVEAGDCLVCRLVVFAGLLPISEDQVRHHVPP
jgi:hypothetical protein